jgi:hypothetical protein
MYDQKGRLDHLRPALARRAARQHRVVGDAREVARTIA